MSADIGSVTGSATATGGPSLPVDHVTSARALQAHYDRVLAESRLKFRVEGEPPRVVIQVIDARSGEVVRQIPNEDALRLADEYSRRDPLGGRVMA
jgi:hypothetical protein